MIVYNQREYVAQAIEGVLMQKTSFPVELIIADDNSTDGTSDICEHFAAQFPDRIKYIKRPANLGMMPNFIEALTSCNGDYIAICEGDDYWVDENKLQMQADFLDANEDFSLVSHNHFFLCDGRLIGANQDIQEDTKILTTRDYMLNPFFHTASYFFRRSALPTPFPEWYENVLAGDHFLVLFISLRGKIGYINERMSVFRMHRSSVTIKRGQVEIKRNFVQHLRVFDRETNFQFSNPINTVIKRWELAYRIYEPGGYFENLNYLGRNFLFYVKNFRRVGGFKLLAKYLFTISVFNRIKTRISQAG